MGKGAKRVGEVSASVAKEVAVEVISIMATHLGSLGLASLQQGKRKGEVEAHFSVRLSQLGRNAGSLFGFAIVRDKEGRVFSYGPIPFGTGSDPADPLVSLGFSNRLIVDMGSAISRELKPAVGFDWERIEYYWAHRLPDGRLVVDHVDESQIHAKAIGTQIRVRSLAIRASRGTNAQKLATQARLFDEMENKFREELRQKNREAQLLTLRNKMRAAQSTYLRATAQRAVALSQADSARRLIGASKALGLVGSFASFLDAANASAAYHGTAMEGSAREYNIHVEKYMFHFEKNTTILPSVLPESPKLDLHKP